MAYRSKVSNDLYRPLMKELSEGKLRPVYLFYGDESFLLESSWLKIKQMAIDETTVDLDAVSYKLDGYGNRLDLKELSMQLRTPPFLSPKRLILVQRSGLFASKAAMTDEAFADLSTALYGMSESSCIVFWEDKYDGRVKRAQQLIEDAGGMIVQFVRQDPETLVNWVRAWLHREKLEIETQACESLIDRCESDMRSITQELTKLKHFCIYKSRTRIDLTLVNLICRPDRRGSIFDLTDAISKGDSAEALRLLHLLWSNKEPSQLILTMLARHFKQLLCAYDWSQSELVKGLSIQPFVAKRLIEQKTHFTAPMLEALYESCYQADNSIKTGKLDDNTALEILLAQAGRAARETSRRRR